MCRFAVAGYNGGKLQICIYRSEFLFRMSSNDHGRSIPKFSNCLSLSCHIQYLACQLSLSSTQPLLIHVAVGLPTTPPSGLPLYSLHSIPSLFICINICSVTHSSCYYILIKTCTFLDLFLSHLERLLALLL